MRLDFTSQAPLRLGDLLVEDMLTGHEECRTIGRRVEDKKDALFNRNGKLNMRAVVRIPFRVI